MNLLYVHSQKAAISFEILDLIRVIVLFQSQRKGMDQLCS